MKKLLLQLLLLVFFVLQSSCGPAQLAGRPTYMHIFFEGPNWVAGRRVLHYSPAFKGKTEEMVAESEATRQLSPLAMMNGSGSETTSVTTTSTTVDTETGTYVTSVDGKMKRQTAEDVRKENQRELANFNKTLTLLDTRADLAKDALSKALNAAAADGWEVVQMTTYGSQGGLVYLLRHR